MTAHIKPEVRVTAGVIYQGDRFLIARRAGDDPLSGKWEFPGGKIEPGESPEECLQRELIEELGMTVRVKKLLASTRYEESSRRIEILFYEGEYVAGDVVLRIHDRVAWVKGRDVARYEFAPADLEFARTLWPLKARVTSRSAPGREPCP